MLGWLSINILLITVAVLTNLFLGVVVFLKNPKSPTHLIFCIFTQVLSGFMVTDYLVDLDILSFNLRVLFLYGDYICGLLGAFFFMVFVVWFPLPEKVGRVFTVLSVITLAYLIFIVLSDLVFFDLTLVNKVLVFKHGPLDAFFVLHVCTLLIYGIIVLFGKYKRSTGIERLQLQYLLIAAIATTLISIFVLLVNRVLYFILSQVDYSYYSVVLFTTARLGILFLVFTMAYVLLRHRLFGVKVVLSKLVLRLGSALFLICCFYLIVLAEQRVFGSFVAPQAILVNVILAVLVSMLFSVYERVIGKWVEQYLLRGNYNAEEVYRDYLLSTIRVGDIDIMMNITFESLNKIFHPVKQGVLFTVDEDEEGNVYSQWTNMDPDEIDQIENERMVGLLTDLRPNRLVLRPEFSESNPARQVMREMGLMAVVPMAKDGLNGFYILGHKVSKGAYTREDIELIEKIIEQLRINLLKLT